MTNPVMRLARQQLLRLLDGQRVQVPTPVGLFVVEAKADTAWQAMKRLPHERVENMTRNHKSLGMLPPYPDEIWANDTYEVIVYRSKEGGAHLSIKRMDRAPIRNWRHFQQMKNEICGPETEGLELFPRESRLADNANQYHVFVLPAGMEIPMGFPAGFVTIKDDEVEAFNTAGGRGRQEPMQEGLTIGVDMQAAQDRDGLDPRQMLARAKVNRA